MTPSYGEDAHRSIGYFSGWIANADSKATALLAVAGLLTVAVLADADNVSTLISTTGTLSCIALGLLAITSVAVLDAYRHLVAVLRPNLDATPAPNRFSFPSIAASDHQAPKDDPAASVEEAWGQAHTLAMIATTKYERIRTATDRLILAGATYIAATAFQTLALA